MSARHAIENLIHTYAERIDLGDFAGVAELFREATYGVEGTEPYRGSAELAAVLTRVIKLHDGSPRTKHVTTNLIVEVDEAAGRAVAHSYFTVLQQVGQGRLQTVVAGRYHDRFERAGDRWRFSGRVIYMDLFGDVAEHLTFSPR